MNDPWMIAIVFLLLLLDLLLSPSACCWECTNTWQIAGQTDAVAVARDMAKFVELNCTGKLTDREIQFRSRRLPQYELKVSKIRRSQAVASETATGAKTGKCWVLWKRINSELSQLLSVRLHSRTTVDCCNTHAKQACLWQASIARL